MKCTYLTINKQITVFLTFSSQKNLLFFPFPDELQVYLKQVLLITEPLLYFLPTKGQNINYLEIILIYTYEIFVCLSVHLPPPFFSQYWRYFGIFCFFYYFGIFGIFMIFQKNCQNRAKGPKRDRRPQKRALGPHTNRDYAGRRFGQHGTSL